VNGTQATASETTRALGHFIVNPLRSEHRSTLDRPRPRTQALLDSALAFAKLARSTVFHSKSLSER
jgi:hypothetical protein